MTKVCMLYVYAHYIICPTPFILHFVTHTAYQEILACTEENIANPPSLSTIPRLFKFVAMFCMCTIMGDKYLWKESSSKTCTMCVSVFKMYLACVRHTFVNCER